MDYSKFEELLKNGEQKNVDFKIRCAAFFNNKLSPKAELAKDICALSNNGNIASYLIIGVSDDGKSFESVSNTKLSDDKLQHFCKMSIFPPPKITLTRKIWKRADSLYKNIEFVIIQIGPHKRQAFHLIKDFINFKEEVCHRRNEVWIRRGSTTDLATPDEIANLAKGQPPIAETEAIDLVKDRENFQKLSIYNKLRNVTLDSINTLLDLQYTDVKGSKIKGLSTYGTQKKYVILYKLIDLSVIIVHLYLCRETLIKNDLRFPGLDYYEEYRFARKTDIPKPVVEIINNKNMAIRRLRIIPVLSIVTNKRIQSALRSWQWTGINSHFYNNNIRDNNISSKHEIFPSSSELLITNNIDCISSYHESFLSAMREIELYHDAVVTPKPK